MQFTNEEFAQMEAYVAQVTKRAPPFIDETFPKQAAFIRDPARRKFAFTTRRAGKSEGAARYLLKEAFENPGTQVLYVGLTRGSAKAIMWVPILKRLSREWGLDVRWNEVELTGLLPNGSLLRLAGADANDNERQKLLGQRNKLVVLDECSSFRGGVRELVWDVLRPTLVDELGTMACIGTPGEVAAGWFYEVTTGQDPGWSGHTWTTHDNPYMAQNFCIELAELKRMDPNIEQKPWYRRQYLGEYVTDTENLVYHFDSKLNTAEALPGGRWTYGLGIDLGWNDDTAFVLIAWQENDPNLYIIDAYSEPKMTFDRVDSFVRSYHEQCGTIAHIVIDNAAKQSVEDMRHRFGWNFIPAQKSGKNDHIGLMNNDLHSGRIKLLPEAEPLVAEWGNLVWRRDKLPPQEDPSCQNHMSDAALYIHRFARHFLGEYDPDPMPERGTKEFANWEARRWEEKDMEDQEREVEWWEQ